MIISQTPLRISFVGGGTDLEEFYKEHTGMVLSASINKYIYIFIHKHYDRHRFLLKYSEIEEGDNINKIKNSLIREAMRLTDVNGVEIVSMSDMPTSGIGLGSSSAFTVGLLNALYAYKGEYKTPDQLAKDACKIEIEILKKPIGKQDQYIVSHGDLNTITFHKDNSVDIEKISLPPRNRQDLESRLLLFFTGKTRSADKILTQQKKNMQNKIESLLKMKNIVTEAKKHLINDHLDEFGKMLHKNWLEKRRLARNITNTEIDFYYKRALSGGAMGGKICGAGGGGFLLLYCPIEKQNDIRNNLADLNEVSFKFENKGSRIILNN